MKRLLLGVWLPLAPAIALAQTMPTATLTGRVADANGLALAGVRVLATSANLQGARAVTTSNEGLYFLALLPSGDYTAEFARDGLATVSRTVSLAAAASVRIDVVMSPATVRATATVTGETSWQRPLDLTQVGVNYSQGLANELPLDRALRSTTLLAPGVTDNGPSSPIGSANVRPALMISGAPSYDSLFLVNGVVVNENLRGQPQDLFIEDAIQETTIETGRISAEYGDFTGGLVNMITRSGGNRFSGSFRTTFTNDAWAANNAHDAAIATDNRVDQVNPTYEVTLGGPLATDRLWFFTAGRSSDLEDSRATRPTALPGDVDPTPVPYVHGTHERRLEGKLTAAIDQGNTVVVSYIGFRENEDNTTFNPNILDTAMLVPVDYTNSLLAVHYGGVLSERLFLEGQYSRLRSSIDQGGPELPDVISGTWIFDKTRQARFHSPVGRPNVPEHYDNDSWLVKASYYLATSTLGGHDLRAGLERLANLTRINPYFSGSDYDIRVPQAIVRGTDVFPVLGPGTAIEYNPVLTPSQGVRTATNSAFANDRVTLGRHWSVNLGVRYDKNDDRDGSGEIISRTGAWSPRLAVAFDPRGDGQLTLVAGYARYVSKNQDTLPVVWLPGGGQPAYFGWRYAGPCINCDPSAPSDQLVSTDEALRRLFAWFSSIGGPASTPTLGALIPGFSTSLQAGGLRSPSVKELSLGAGFVFGSHGYVRADLLHRDWSDLYSSRIDLQTGETPPDPYGNVFDIAVIGNSNELVRRYEALQAQLAYSFAAIRIGGSYTLSRLSGNSSPEVRCCAAVPAAVLQYPEYVDASWNHPTGDLSSFGDPGQPAADQRHRARLWIAGDLSTSFGIITPALLESVDSGLPYEAVGFIDPTPWVNNPGYQTPPTQVAYFFSRPAAFRTDTITRTDVAVTWALPVGHLIQVFVKPEVLNLFNERGVVAVDTTVATLEPFDPFHEKPIRGVNYELGPYFGKPTSAAGYQLPRTFRFSVGIRF